MSLTLTHAELAALRARHNLADGHAHQDLTNSQAAIINTLPEIYYQAATEPLEVIQDRFRAAFYEQHCQSYMLCPAAHLLYSASIGIHVAARLVADQKLRLGLVTPTFDNIHDLLSAQCITPIPLDESSILDPSVWDKAHLDALFLVLPNNPTGWSLDKDEFLELAMNAASRNMLLIIDYSFRYFDHKAPDGYALLTTAGCKFIAIEDTGKYLSALDIKVGLVASDIHTSGHVRRIVEDILLNVSPFTLEILTRLIRADNRHETLNLVSRNREALRSVSDSIGVVLNSRLDTHSVEWISAVPPAPNMKTLLARWHQRGVHVLPGGPFWWDDSRRGDNYARVALIRSEVKFRQALNEMVSE